MAPHRRWVGTLERYAPTWLGEIPGLLDPDARRRLAGGIPSINRDPMVRELADAIEEISTHQPIVLLLEDLHWSDAATLETIDSLARRTETGARAPPGPAGGEFAAQPPDEGRRRRTAATPTAVNTTASRPSAGTLAVGAPLRNGQLTPSSSSAALQVDSDCSD